MSVVSLPVNRPAGRGLVVGNQVCRAQPLAALERLGFECSESDNPYDAMVQLCREPSRYNSIILSLNALYREELQIISSVRRRLPSIEIWLAHTDGRQAALADCIRMGADGLLAEDGLHRMGSGLPVMPIEPPAPPATVAATAPAMPPVPPSAPQSEAHSARSPLPQRSAGMTPGRVNPGEPILTAEELRALLEEQPAATSDELTA